MRYWKRVKNRKTTAIESYSHDLDIDGAVEITQLEFNDFMDSIKGSIISIPKEKSFDEKVREEVIRMKQDGLI